MICFKRKMEVLDRRLKEATNIKTIRHIERVRKYLTKRHDKGLYK